MKKSPLKEFIITSIAAAVAGFIVKRGYEYFQDATNTSSKKETSNTRSLSATAEQTVSKTAKNIGEKLEQHNQAEKGLIATLAYSFTAFMITKLLRKVI